MRDVKEFLSAHHIEYISHEHPAVYTCEEAERYCDSIPGVSCKNLFLRNKKGKRFFLVILLAEKQTDLKKFAILAQEGRISFASSESLQEKLGLHAGSVSPFELLNDSNYSVELWIDRDIYDANIVSSHPNVNTETLELSKNMFHKFLQVIDYKIHVIDL